MNAVIDSIRRRAQRWPDAPAIATAGADISVARLWRQIGVMVNELKELRSRTVAVALDNGAGWICTDLAVIALGLDAVPVPPFFSPAQLGHTLGAARVDTLVTASTEQAVALAELGGRRFRDLRRVELAAERVYICALEEDSAGESAPSASGAKISFTSGATGQPKGAILEHGRLCEVARSLAGPTGAGAADRHLCVFPLAQLLENVAGVYLCLMVGAVVCLDALENLGWSGSTGLDVERLAGRVEAFSATTLIVAPQILIDAGRCAEFIRIAGNLRLVAVGGAPISTTSVEHALGLGIPVRQGYGFTEAGSVVALNPIGADRSGSVGLPLCPGDVSIGTGSEILVRNPGFRGYMGDTARSAAGWWKSGDCGDLDDDGYLYVTGRLKTVYSTGYGRNVAPEWVEAELAGEPGVYQAVVFGEGEAGNTALVYGDHGAIDAVHLRRSVNRRLPDYARIMKIVLLEEPLSVRQGLLNETGIIQRDAVVRRFCQS